MSGIRILGKKCFEFGVYHKLPTRKQPALYLHYAGKESEVLAYFTSVKNAKKFERAINILADREFT